MAVAIDVGGRNGVARATGRLSIALEGPEGAVAMAAEERRAGVPAGHDVEDAILRHIGDDRVVHREADAVIVIRYELSLGLTILDQALKEVTAARRRVTAPVAATGMRA